MRRTREEGKSLGAAIYRIEHRWTLPPNGKPDWPAILLNPEDSLPPGIPYELIDPTVHNPDANYRELMKYRGAELLARRLAEMPHVTPYLINEHMAQAEAHGQDVMTALYRIEHNEPFPDEWMYAPSADHQTKEAIREFVERLRSGRRFGSGREAPAESLQTAPQGATNVTRKP